MNEDTNIVMMFAAGPYFAYVIGPYVFRKAKGANIVNIFVEGSEHEIDCFTDYEIKDDIDRFAESCFEWVEYQYNCGDGDESIY